MAKILIIIGTLWALGSAAVPALESWDMGSSINSIGHEQIAQVEE